MTLQQILEKEREEFEALWAKDDVPRLHLFAVSFLTASHKRILEAVIAEAEGKKQPELADISTLGKTSITAHNAALYTLITSLKEAIK